MKVRMKGTISGTRDGRDWPAAGEVAEFPDAEGAALCASGLADPVKSEPPVEKAVKAAPDPVGAKTEPMTTQNGPAKRGPGRPRKNPA
jgi:hypothetical protein